MPQRGLLYNPLLNTNYDDHHYRLAVPAQQLIPWLQILRRTWPDHRISVRDQYLMLTAEQAAWIALQYPGADVSSAVIHLNHRG